MKDTTEMIPGRVYIIEGHPWGKCGDCGKILRLDRWCGSLHICTSTHTPTHSNGYVIGADKALADPLDDDCK